MNIPIEIEVKNLDHLGIIAGIIDDIAIEKIVNKIVGIEEKEKVNGGRSLGVI